MKSWLKNIGAAVLLPTVLLSLFLTFDEKAKLHLSDNIQYIALALSLLAGVVFLWRLPISTRMKLLFSVIYFIGGGFGLLYYSLMFVCTVFGNCL
jgi:hypothetical protein